MAFTRKKKLLSFKCALGKKKKKRNLTLRKAFFKFEKEQGQRLHN